MIHLPKWCRRVLGYVLVGSIGFVVGVITLYVVILTTRPALQPWHTAELDAEFVAARADDVRTLDDYLRLEDRLFAQLGERVYAETPQGAAYALARYSTGSAADPRRRAGDWNRTHELRADAPIGGVLLLHGMSDSPYSLHALAATLHARGYTVVALRLPGHGTAPSGLCRATWQDMAAAVRLAMRHLRTAVGERPLHVVGYSNGAALALNHCLDALDGVPDVPMPASLVLISPAVGVSPVAAFASWQRRLSALPGLEQLAWTDVEPEFDPYKYNSFAVNAGQQVHELTVSLAARIAARAAAGPVADLPPVLAFLSTVDATVSADAVVDNLLRHLAPGRAELVLFDVNRADAALTILVEDPGPLTARLLADEALPFALTLVTNAGPDSTDVVSRRKPALSGSVVTTALGLAWPRGVLSLSHVALPFPPDDPLYGSRAPAEAGVLYLGHLAVQAERGLLKFPADWLLRLRHNPFYTVVETRALEWLAAAPR